MEASRRDLLGVAVGGLGVLGAIGVLYPIVKVLSPSQASLAGARVEVDVSQIPDLQVRVVSWKGKPVFVVKLPQGFQWNGKRLNDQNAKAPARTRRLRPCGSMHPSWLCAPVETTGRRRV